MPVYALSRVIMPADPPFILPSSHPFKVEATPSKMGGVDALAKRPLDMTGKAEPLDEHREAVPGDAVPSDTWVSLPEDADAEQAGDGPVLQEQIDTSHREYFDDPSRYLRTDAVVKLPTTGSSHSAHAASMAGHDDATATEATPERMTLAGVEQHRNARQLAQQTRAARQALSMGPRPSPRPKGTPQQRREAFNQRLASIISRQEHIKDELSAVEQAVQASRAKLEQDAADEKPHSA